MSSSLGSKPRSLTGKLIVFEGGEGSGKSTQLQRLYTWLRESPQLKQLQASGRVGGLMATREPGGTALGSQLRQLLLDHDSTAPIDSRTELLLYAADRAQHVAETLRPALEKGFWVLCDRYTDSTLAYQGYGRQLDRELIRELNQVATGGLESDLTLWLKVDAETGLSRLQQRQADRIEQSSLAFHQRVQAGFEVLALAHPQRIVTVDGSRSEAAVAVQIQSLIETQLLQWYPQNSPPNS
nr:dTMP kinase [Romeria gracilis]